MYMIHCIYQITTIKKKGGEHDMKMVFEVDLKDNIKYYKKTSVIYSHAIIATYKLDNSEDVVSFCGNELLAQKALKRLTSLKWEDVKFYNKDKRSKGVTYRITEIKKMEE